MALKKSLFCFLCGALLCLGACSSDNTVSSPDIGSSSSGGGNISSSGGGSPSNVALADGANAAFAQNAYGLFMSYHFTTMENETSVYPTLGAEYDVVFANYKPAGRIVWSTQSNTGYKNLCAVENATVPEMTYRGCTVSEGIGYGMLLSYFQGDDDTFVRLWNYSRAFRTYNHTNLTPWITLSFHYKTGDNSSATDADLDIATALILQYYRTGNMDYLADAMVIANALWDEEINPSNNLIYSGNTGMWTSPSITPVYNLSYFSPVALRLFAELDKNHNWAGVLDAMYQYMQDMQAKGTGVFPDWSTADLQSIEPPNKAAGNAVRGYTYFTFNKESVRIPWRIAWDYYWYQDERAKAVLSKLNEFIVGKSGGDPNSIALATNYSWDLTLGADISENSVTPTQWLAAWCATGIAGNKAWLNACTDAVNQKTPSNNGSSYFPDILLALYSQMLNGMFLRPF